MLQIKNLTITHRKDNRVLMQDVSFALNDGDKLAIIGEEGNGKSSLLKLIYDENLVDEYLDYTGEIVKNNACIGYLREQFRLIRPRVVVCLGRIAAMRLIRPDYRITREHGQWVQKGGVWMTAVYHPSALLRDLSKREDMLRDMWAIRQKLEELGVAPCVEDTANE